MLVGIGMSVGESILVGQVSCHLIFSIEKCSMKIGIGDVHEQSIAILLFFGLKKIEIQKMVAIQHICPKLRIDCFTMNILTCLVLLDNGKLLPNLYQTPWHGKHVHVCFKTWCNGSNKEMAPAKT